jgi:hypothetical protein
VDGGRGSGRGAAPAGGDQADFIHNGGTMIGFLKRLLRRPARLCAVVECHCGRTVEVPEEQRVLCKCGAELWWYKGGAASVDKLCSKMPSYYPWGERSVELLAVRFIV